MLRFGSQLVVGSTLIGGLTAVGLAGLSVRATIGVVEFNLRCARVVGDIIRDPFNALPSAPLFPGPSVEVFAEEVRKDLEPELEAKDYLVIHEEKEVDEEGKSKVVRQRSTVNRHKKGRFVHRLVCDGKNHFGGTPSASRANELAVMKYLVGKCREHHLVVQHTREVCSLAMAAIFTPDHHEVNMVREMNSHAAYRRRVALADAARVHSWQQELLRSPLSWNAWGRAWWIANGLPDREPVRFTK
nr:RNA polymerase pre-readthrough protein [Pelargonium flower break virus]